VGRQAAVEALLLRAGAPRAPSAAHRRSQPPLPRVRR
jgi:hypothetical protein